MPVKVSLHISQSFPTCQSKFPYISVKVSLHASQSFLTYQSKFPYISVKVSLHASQSLLTYQSKFPYMPVKVSLHISQSFPTYQPMFLSEKCRQLILPQNCRIRRRLEANDSRCLYQTRHMKKKKKKMIIEYLRMCRGLASLRLNFCQGCFSKIEPYS